MSERLVVIGSQWGDEGKGKITDYFACKADMVVRYQGGNNAGHTVVFDGHKYSLQSIPSGIFNPKTVNVMANGMVVNPVSVVEELERLHKQGITDYQLYISDRAAVVMPYHSALDGAYEALKGGAQIGTTKKGIGPAYADKYSRVGIRMGDLLEPDYFAERLRAALEVKNMELKLIGKLARTLGIIQSIIERRSAKYTVTNIFLTQNTPCHYSVFRLKNYVLPKRESARTIAVIFKVEKADRFAETRAGIEPSYR